MSPDDNCTEEIINALEEVKSRIKEKDDKIHEILEEKEDDEDFNPEHLLGRTSGYLRSAVEINKKIDELKEE